MLQVVFVERKSFRDDRIIPRLHSSLSEKNDEGLTTCLLAVGQISCVSQTIAGMVVVSDLKVQ